MYLEAIEAVLRRAGKPLHIKEAVDIAKTTGLLQARGLTPVASAGAAIYNEMRKNGSISTFVQVGPAVFGLRSQLQPAMETAPGKRPMPPRPRRRSRSRRPATEAAPGKKGSPAAKIAAAGRYRVASELIFRGYEADMGGGGGGVHILARRGGKTFSMHVATMSRHPAGQYIRTVREALIRPGGERPMLYTFLLRGSRGRDDDFVTLPSSTIDALIDSGRISKNKAGYQVRLAVAGNGATVGGADATSHLNNWDLDDLARRRVA